MYNICVCEGCGRTIDNDFLYCPWCGFSKISHNKATSLDAMFNYYEKSIRDNRRKHLYEMKKEIDELEEELSVMALSAEIHK